MADPVVVVDGADPVTVVRRGLDGSGAQHGQGDSGGDQLVHRQSFEVGITQRPTLGWVAAVRNEELEIDGRLTDPAAKNKQGRHGSDTE